MLPVPVGDGSLAVQFGRSLEGADSVLRRLRWILLAVILGGVALAVALGRVVSRNVVAPIAHVTEAARHIAATGTKNLRDFVVVNLSGNPDVALTETNLIFEHVRGRGAAIEP